LIEEQAIQRSISTTELAPISGGYRNAFGGWAATLVDTLDTLHIMGMTQDFDIAVAATKDIDFSISDEETLNVSRRLYDISVGSSLPTFSVASAF
jgi:hypothetical protein